MKTVVVKPKVNNLSEIYIDELKLNSRTLNALHREGVYTIQKLIDIINTNKIFKIRNIGEKAIKEIFIKLDANFGTNYFTSLEKLYNVVWYNPDAQEEQIIHVRAKSEREASMVALLIMNKSGRDRFTVDSIENILEVDEKYYINFDEAIKRHKINLDYAAQVVRDVNEYYKNKEDE